MQLEHDKRSFLVWTYIQCQSIGPLHSMPTSSNSRRNELLNWTKKYSERPKSGSSRENVEIVLEHLRVHPKSSNWRYVLPISQSSFSWIMRKNLKLRAFKMSSRHQLLEDDCQKGATFLMNTC